MIRFCAKDFNAWVQTRLIASVFFLLLLSSSTHSAPVAHNKVFTVAIDPGHGGSDHGAIYRSRGKTYREKSLTLLLGFEIERQLRARGVQTIMTRRNDRDLTLADRTALANQMQADVFISIHMNSSHSHKKKTAGGIETYILNTSTNASSRRLAHLENSVLKGSFAESLKQSDVSLIIKDLTNDANLRESKHVACNVQKRLGRWVAKSDPKKDRGVKQALFHVLLAADMPSILLEAGFINHPSDRQNVLSKRGRKKIAAAVANAMIDYKKHRRTKKARRALAKCQVR